MDKPKSPCKKDCEFRSAKCHNESCPYGWAEYEEQRKKWIEYCQKRFNLHCGSEPITIARKQLGHRNQLAKKRKNKTL